MTPDAEKTEKTEKEPSAFVKIKALVSLGGPFREINNGNRVAPGDTVVVPRHIAEAHMGKDAKNLEIVGDAEAPAATTRTTPKEEKRETTQRGHQPAMTSPSTRTGSEHASKGKE